MTALLFIGAALCGYLISGLNPAIILSKAIYHKDIRECGSGNPGFTNFKRSFGGKLAWCVLILDLTKAAIVALVFGFLFKAQLGDFQLGAVYTGAFAMLGHAYPIFYKFKGGKGFLVSLSTMWVVDWRSGLIATVLMVILLLTTKYMSLSTVAAMLTCPLTLWLFDSSLTVILICTGIVLFMAIRHYQNFIRLFKGTENRFYLFDKKNKAVKEPAIEAEKEPSEVK